MGRIGGSDTDLTTSADTRSFSGSLPILILGNWESKNEWIWNGCDRWKLLGRNTLKIDELKENAIRHGETKALESIVIANAISMKGSSFFCRLFRATLSCGCEIIGA